MILFDWELDDKGKKISRGGSEANYRLEIMDADGSHRRPLKIQGAKVMFLGSLGDWR